ncbi:hypothetical protein AKJ44_01300 [candidate division MSBL1 archaeon SCGC-AAA261F17]|uniref:Antitoxin n=1 Tax=candidate division MSBL1 archaeon SCGC-AAA261F17 TaxID=1698274 RepID=A0A133V6S6_9EURY|nr:hypothetical protein AKJ44_01300 [candidate division MSBL1 archaeon SCGC-AAA261F17]
MVTTISVSEDTRKELTRLKTDLGSRSFDALLKEMLAEMRNRRLEEISKRFRESLKEKGLTLDDIQKEARRIRGEIYEEEFK